MFDLDPKSIWNDKAETSQLPASVAGPKYRFFDPQHEEAIKRHASPPLQVEEEESGPAEPPRVHDPASPGALAGRRRMVGLGRLGVISPASAEVSGNDTAIMDDGESQLVGPGRLGIISPAAVSGTNAAGTEDGTGDGKDGGPTTPTASEFKRILEECVSRGKDVDRIVEVFERMGRMEAERARRAYAELRERCESELREERSLFESELSVLRQGVGGGSGADVRVWRDPDAEQVQEMMELNHDLEKHWREEHVQAPDGIWTGEDVLDDSAQQKVGTGSLAVPGMWPPHTPAVSDLSDIDMTALFHTNPTPLTLEIKVRHRLLPAIVLLSHPAILTESDINDASRLARVAQDFALRHRCDAALIARCAYYIGLAEYLSHNIVGASPVASPTDLPCLEYFEQARGAQGVYTEGEWAEEWIRYLNGLLEVELSPSVSRRPESAAGRWIGGLFHWVRGSKEVEEAPRSVARELETTARIARQRVGSPNPLSSTFASSKTQAAIEQALETNKPKLYVKNPDPPSSPSTSSKKSTGGEQTNSQSGSSIVSPSNPAQRSRKTSKYRRANPSRHPIPSTSQGPTSSHAAEAVDDIQVSLPHPVTSPSPTPHSARQTSTVHSPKGSPQDEQSTTSSPWPTHRRKPSFLAQIITGRERRPSELERAEEGQSPWKARFEGTEEEPEDSPTGANGVTASTELRARKVSRVEDMV